jgi:hypothetical protein
MTLRHALVFACLLVSSLVCADASAAYYYGKFDYAQSDFSSSTRMHYYNVAAGLHIYTTPGGNADLMQAAFMRKAPVDVTYSVIACPAGISGTCGSIIVLNVSAVTIP